MKVSNVNATYRSLQYQSCAMFGATFKPGYTCRTTVGLILEH